MRCLVSLFELGVMSVTVLAFDALMLVCNTAEAVKLGSRIECSLGCDAEPPWALKSIMLEAFS